MARSKNRILQYSLVILHPYADPTIWVLIIQSGPIGRPSQPYPLDTASQLQ